MKQILLNAFPGGANRVLTFSYDDGVAQDRRLVNIFNASGVKGTFHLNAGLLGNRPRHIDPDEVSSLYAGHEVSCHSYTHPFLDHIPQAALIEQVLADRRALETLAGYPVRGMSYPFGTASPAVVDTLGALGIAYSRTTKSTGAFDLPDAPLTWNPTCHHNHDLKDLSTQFHYRGDRYPNRLHLMYVWGHSYEFDSDGNWDAIEEFCTGMADHARTWYATNIQIVDYLEALRRLRFSADCSLVENPSSQTVCFTADGKRVDVAGGQVLAL